MARPIPRKLLDAATAVGEGAHVVDIENVKAVSLQPSFTAKRLAVAIKGLMLGSPEPCTIHKFDSLTTKSGQLITLRECPSNSSDPIWPVGIEEVWAEVLAIDGGDATVYFCGRE